MLKSVILPWNAELDIQALKSLGRYLTFRYLQKPPFFTQVDGIVSFTVQRTERELIEAEQRLKDEIRKENESCCEDDA